MRLSKHSLCESLRSRFEDCLNLAYAKATVRAIKLTSRVSQGNGLRVYAVRLAISKSADQRVPK